MKTRMATLVMTLAVVLMVQGTSTAATLLQENFDSPSWTTGDNVAGKNGWQTNYYYGAAEGSAQISGSLSGIGGNGYGLTYPISGGGGAAKLFTAYTTGQVYLNAKFRGDGSSGFKGRVFLGTSDLVTSDNTAITAMLDSHSGYINWYVYRNGGDVDVQSGVTPFAANTWYEYEICVDLDADTAYQGFYSLDQGTLARSSGLTTLVTHTGVAYSSIEAAGFSVDGDAHIYWDELVVAQIPEPGTIILMVTGLVGLLAYAWRKRK